MWICYWDHLVITHLVGSGQPGTHCRWTDGEQTGFCRHPPDHHHNHHIIIIIILSIAVTLIFLWIILESYPHPDHHNDHLNDGGPDGEALASLELGREREKASVLHVQVAVHLVKEGGRCYILLGDFLLKYLLSIWSRGGGEAVFWSDFSDKTICCISGQGRNSQEKQVPLSKCLLVHLVS